MAATSSFGGDFKIWVSGSYAEDQIVHKTGWRCQYFGSYKGRPMTADTFSADGSVLAIAADTFITLWDPDTNVLIAVVGDTLFVALSFIDKSTFLVSLSQGSRSQLAVCGALQNCHCTGHTSFLQKAKGGGLAFLSSSKPSKIESPKENVDSLLAYVNGDHEYMVFNPFSTGENQVGRKVRKNQFPAEETVCYGYSSIYGDLPDFDLKKEKVSEISYVPAQRCWETLLNAPWRDLPPLTILCNTNFQSLQKQRPNEVLHAD